MFTRFKSIFFCLLLLSMVCEAEVSDNYINQLNAEFSKIKKADVENNRYGYSFNSVVEKLRAMDEAYTASHTMVLVRLKDELTIQKYLDRFIQSRGLDNDSKLAFSSSQAPWIVPMLMNLVSQSDIKREELTGEERDLSYYGLSGESLEIVHAIVSRSEDFPVEVNEWASSIKLRGESAMNDARKVYLKWWELNKTAFEAEDYAEVDPLGENTIADVTPPFPAQEVEEIDEVVAPEPAVEESAEVAVTDPIEADVEQFSNWWLWLIGAVIVVGGIGLIARRKK